jgi:hypothetical protein
VVGNRDGLLDVPEYANLDRLEQAHRSIVRIIDPNRYGLNVRDFILADS